MTTTSQKRTQLSTVLPLKTPFIIQMFPAYACNFKCEYCIHAVNTPDRGYISNKKLMDMGLYKKAIDDMTEFSDKIKMLRFAGMGEPLMHPQIAEMVEYAVSKNVAQSIEIVTNGELLTRQLSQKLMDAGLSKLRISLEGICGADYAKHCGKEIDFDKLVEELSYFYKNKKDTVVYIKIIDYMLKTKEQEERFYKLFGDISDQIAIEHLTPTVAEIDYTKVAGDIKLEKSQNGGDILNSKICSTPFYFMQINPDGNVVPCCNTKYPAILGDVNTQGVEQIWNGKVYKNFLSMSLNGTKNSCEECGKCNIYLYGTYKEDLLDAAAETLRGYYHE